MEDRNLTGQEIPLKEFLEELLEDPDKTVEIVNENNNYIELTENEFNDLLDFN